MQQRNRSTIIVAVVLTFLIATIGRLIPHLANATPLTSLALLSGFLFNKRLGLIIIGSSLLMSDLLLSLIHGYAMFGSWTLFTYSGFLLITFFSPSALSQHRFLKLGGFLVSVTMLYWLWTNLGTWLFSGLYVHTASGLGACYLMALPFLGHAMLGNILYTSLFLICLSPMMKRINRKLAVTHV